MTTFTTSCKPLPFYADGEAPLEELVDRGKSSEAATRGNIGDMTKYVPNGTRCKELSKQWL
jgi:hypothetical protein